MGRQIVLTDFLSDPLGKLRLLPREAFAIACSLPALAIVIRMFEIEPQTVHLE